MDLNDSPKGFPHVSKTKYTAGFSVLVPPCFQSALQKINSCEPHIN